MITWGLDHFELIFRILRNVWPIPAVGKLTLITRFDDVKEVLALSEVFVNPYTPKLDVIMGGHPFFLGMTNTEQYTRDTVNMRMVVRRTDIESILIPATIASTQTLLAGNQGELEVVDFVRTVTFDVFCKYFGIPSSPGSTPLNGQYSHDLRVWLTRLFEFQFVDGANDPALRAEVDIYAPALRDYIDSQIAARKSEPQAGQPAEDVLGRCLELQLLGVPGMDDATIRSNLVGLLVGGMPQPPMGAPQALEQLLRRPAALARAQQAARQNDDKQLLGCVLEGMRFDPIAPMLFRTAAEDYTIAPGTPRAHTIRKGTSVAAVMRSAMHDGRRVPSPETFNSDREPYQYLHFGYGLHACFGVYINLALLPLMLKPILLRENLRRAPGAAGHLTKQGAFADQLMVNFDA